jgi:hypothetical protein
LSRQDTKIHLSFRGGKGRRVEEKRGKEGDEEEKVTNNARGCTQVHFSYLQHFEGAKDANDKSSKDGRVKKVEEVWKRDRRMERKGREGKGNGKGKGRETARVKVEGCPCDGAHTISQRGRGETFFRKGGKHRR